MIKKVTLKTQPNSLRVHLCYLSDDTLQAWDNLGESVEYWVARWAREDFKMKRVETAKDLKKLKLMVAQLYMETYPELFHGSVSTDRHGWFRVWVTRHIKEELENHG